MTLDDFNKLNDQQAYQQLMLCNTSSKWCQAMIAQRPWESLQSLMLLAIRCWLLSDEEDLLEAFEGHPQIGDITTLREKYQESKAIAGDEQSGVEQASEKVLQDLASGNKAYYQKMGFIFIVCASGKTAEEMLELLQERLNNSRQQELDNAAIEQAKITQIRLQKLFE